MAKSIIVPKRKFTLQEWVDWVKEHYVPDPNSKHYKSLHAGKVDFRRYKISSKKPAFMQNLVQTNHERILALRKLREQK